MTCTQHQWQQQRQQQRSTRLHVWQSLAVLATNDPTKHDGASRTTGSRTIFNAAAGSVDFRVGQPRDISQGAALTR